MKDILISDLLTRKFIYSHTTKEAGTKNPIGEWDIEDPTYLGFNIEFLFDAVESSTSVAAGLLLPRGNPLSACNYLDRIDEPSRADLLERFVKDLKKMSEEYPWYFKTVRGLQKLSQINMEDGIRLKKDDYIEIQTLESIDMKMTRLFDLYRKATYDTHNMRDMLPQNMRQFNMRIHITEIRKFHTFTIDDSEGFENGKPKSPLLQAYGGITDIYNLSSNTKVGNSIRGLAQNAVGSNASLAFLDEDTFNPLRKAAAKIKSLDNFISVMTFNISKCTFDLNEFNPFLEEASNAPDEAAEQKIKIWAMKVSETNVYPISKLVLRDAIINSQFVGKTRKINITSDGKTQPGTYVDDTDLRIDDIVSKIYPNVPDSASTNDIKIRKEEDLKGNNLLGNVIGGYKSFKSDLERKLQNFGINYNPLSAIEGELQNRAQNVLDRLVLGNIHGVTPSNLINTIQNGLNNSQGGGFTMDRNIEFSDAGDDFKADPKIELTSSASKYDIANNPLEGGDSNLKPDANVNLQGGTPGIGTPGNVGLSGSGSSLTPPGNVGLQGGANPLTPAANIGLQGGTSFGVTQSPLTGAPANTGISQNGLTGAGSSLTPPKDIGLTGGSGLIDPEKNIGLTGSSHNSSVTPIKLESQDSSIEITGKVLGDAAKTDSTISPISMTAASAMLEISAKNVFDRLNMQEYQIKNIELDASKPKMEIQDIDLKSSGSSIEISGKAIHEEPSNDASILPIHLESSPKNENIENIQLKSPEKHDEIISIKPESLPYKPLDISETQDGGIAYNRMKIDPNDNVFK